MLGEVAWQTEVKLGVEIARGVDAQLQLAAGNVVEHLHNAVFGVGVVVRLTDVVDQLVAVLFHHLIGVTVGIEQQVGVVVVQDGIDIDADKDAYLADILQLPAQLEIS